MASVSLQVFVRAGHMQYTWAKVSTVRHGVWRPYQCTDGDGPHTRIRWRRP